MINEETAKQEIERWLDMKRVKKSTRETHKHSIKSMIEAVSDGTLVVNEDGTLVQTLDFPLTSENGNVDLDKLTFQLRLQHGVVKAANKGTNPSDVDERLMSYVFALTGVPKSKLNKLESTDMSFAMMIAGFFM